MLWFGDERGYNATPEEGVKSVLSCGLVMKEDITQLSTLPKGLVIGCGLVMKEDITQHFGLIKPQSMCCGLVMKEDITQQLQL